MIAVSVCVGSAYHLKGLFNVISELQDLVETNNLGDKVDIKAIFCIGHCTEAVSVRLNDQDVESVNSKAVKEVFINRVMSLAVAD